MEMHFQIYKHFKSFVDCYYELLRKILSKIEQIDVSRPWKKKLRKKFLWETDFYENHKNQFLRKIEFHEKLKIRVIICHIFISKFENEEKRKMIWEWDFNVCFKGIANTIKIGVASSEKFIWIPTQLLISQINKSAINSSNK